MCEVVDGHCREWRWHCCGESLRGSINAAGITCGTKTRECRRMLQWHWSRSGEPVPLDGVRWMPLEELAALVQADNTASTGGTRVKECPRVLWWHWLTEKL
ncbi:hypothetical protein PIB30_007997 [Stylosanthes scabra]|uniref:Uncharacterized protein n=1 Tax=Stylosanthes scabra TaxID=79078 RepID=A0ABU6U3L7_9FABA|nr:hypothetical protein [Stylosanthes scabra]